MRNHRLDGRSLTLEYASPAATARSGSGTQTFNNPAAEAQMVEGVPVKVRPPPTPKTSTKKRLMKKERIAARLAAGLPPTVPVDAPNNPMPPPRNFGGERLAAKRVRGEDDQGADAAGDSATWEERKRPKPMNKWEKAGRTAPGGSSPFTFAVFLARLDTDSLCFVPQVPLPWRRRSQWRSLRPRERRSCSTRVPPHLSLLFAVSCHFGLSIDHAFREVQPKDVRDIKSSLRSLSW